MEKNTLREYQDVSIYRDFTLEYPTDAPFNPSEKYPEYPLEDLLSGSSLPNRVYGAVRESIRLLGLDNQYFGTVYWNPFRTFIKPGNIVVIKPNAVWDINLNREHTVFASITHGSVVRAVIDYVFIALEGKGKIVVADCPLAHSNFANWRRITGIDDIVAFYRRYANFEIDVLDLRRLYSPWDHVAGFAPSEKREYMERDPAGYMEIDLGSESMFAELGDRLCSLFYGSDYNRELTVRHHTNGHHRYLVARTFLNADALISVPKLKVHSKVGVTLNIKGFVGTQGDKNYIPHHRIGVPTRGGDESPDLGFFQNALNRYRMWLLTSILSKETAGSDRAFRLLSPVLGFGQRLADALGRRRKGNHYIGNIVGGAWYGNDTAWRMALDLARIILYSDREGRLQNSPQRQLFAVIDGVVGGELEGPLSPTARHSGVIVAGANMLAVDKVAARLMGFDPQKIRLLERGQQQVWLDICDRQIRVYSNRPDYEDFWNSATRYLNYVPPKGWRGHIEIEN